MNTASVSSADTYIHGSAPIEQRRLSRLRARAIILSTAHIQEQAFDDAIAALDDWSRRGDAAFWFAMCWAQGFKPESNPSHLETLS